MQPMALPRAFMPRDPLWARNGVDWPQREASRFVRAAGLQWHVQRLGAGPALLLIHGAGASTHSWRDLAPLLATKFTVLAFDLPGHAFTDPMPPPRRPSLPEISDAVGELLRVEQFAPLLAVGHSAGAAIMLRMRLDGAIASRALISLNGALRAPRGLAALVFSPAARWLAGSRSSQQWLTRRAHQRGAVARLIASTGSTLDAAGVAFYEQLVRSADHLRGVLDMMANWDLDALERDLRRLATPLWLVVGANDRAVPTREATSVQARVQGARVHWLDGLGHLAHEEAPDRVAEVIFEAAHVTGVLDARLRA